MRQNLTVSWCVLISVVMCVHCQKLSVVFKDSEDDETCSKDQIASGLCQTKSKSSITQEDPLLFVPPELGEVLDQCYRTTEDKDSEPDMPFFVDLFGYKYNWTNLEDGWNEDRRKEFFREHRRNSEQATWMPGFTKTGYKKMKMPKELFQYILENRQADKLYSETCNILFNCDKIIKFTALEGQKLKPIKFLGYIKRNTTAMMEWRNESEAIEKIDSVMRPILESWIGGQVPLNFSVAYGVRRYFNGSSLGLHLDKPTTHVISAILQIDQKVEEDWPLTIIDFNFKKKKLFLKPGEMILYESSKAPHGRQYPLRGDYFDNLFVHYKPGKKWYTESDFPSGKESPALRRRIKLEDLIVNS